MPVARIKTTSIPGFVYFLFTYVYQLLEDEEDDKLLSKKVLELLTLALPQISGACPKVGGSVLIVMTSSWNSPLEFGGGGFD